MEEREARSRVRGPDQVQRPKSGAEERKTTATRLALIKSRIREIDVECARLRAKQQGLELALTIMQGDGV